MFVDFTFSKSYLGEEELDGQDQPFSEVVEDMDPEVLSKQCPHELESVTLDDIVVWVDPLDGTNEFAQVCATHLTAISCLCDRV